MKVRGVTVIFKKNLTVFIYCIKTEKAKQNKKPHSGGQQRRAIKKKNPIALNLIATVISITKVY